MCVWCPVRNFRLLIFFSPLFCFSQDAFVELYARKKDSVFSGSWPSLTTSVFSLAALGAVGLTIGAYLNQK